MYKGLSNINANAAFPYAGLAGYGGYGDYGARDFSPGTQYSVVPDVSAPRVGLKLKTDASSLIPSLSATGLGAGAGSGAGNTEGGWWSDLWKGAVGTKDVPGWGGMALGAANFAGNMYMGMKQYGIAKQQLAESKRQFEKNYEAQRKMTNSSLEDRQRGRNLASPGEHESPEVYMAKYGIK